MSRLERLNERYRTHHAENRGSDFVFGGNARASAIARFVGGPGLRVLDVGCRTGALTQHYAPGNHVVGVDVDRDALAYTAERLEIETLWADVEETLPFDDASFDVVVAGEILEHLADPAAAVDQVRRVLKPGGRFVGSVPNAFRLKSRLAYAAGRLPGDHDPTHLQLFSPHALRALLAAFEDVQIEFVVGRLVPLHARLFANDQVFSARKHG
ncbi:MAG: hypothetical protein QOF75_1393 [Gaiellaceae bacterium]|jgi:SAM-dependent methyltransferase|nr:hypothetical protein [Gaiellaceae bacterium]